MDFPNLNRTEPTQKRIRRNMWRQIVLPFSLGVLSVILLTMVAFAVGRTSVTASLLVTICILIPLIIVTFVAFLLTLTLNYGLYRSNKAVRMPLRKLEALSYTVNDKVTETAGTVNEQIIRVSSKTAPFEAWMNDAFTARPSSEENTSGD